MIQTGHTAIRICGRGQSDESKQQREEGLGDKNDTFSLRRKIKSSVTKLVKDTFKNVHHLNPHYRTVLTG